MARGESEGEVNGGNPGLWSQYWAMIVVCTEDVSHIVISLSLMLETEVYCVATWWSTHTDEHFR